LKKRIVLLFVFLSVILVPCAFAQDTLSGEILTQAKAQADLFLELKNALGLDWLDKYNTYLRDPSANPEPSWTLSVQDLINNGYLSAGFPSDFSLSLSGAEVVISRPVSTQSIRDAVTIYLPSATISGNTVSLLVQRPAQWVAYEAALNGKVDRDGSGDPDILPGASLDFASGTSINFLSNDGKILGVDSLTYKGEEIEDRFVNVSGDNMTGPLYIEGNIVWHAGNDGSGSGLDADLFDGKDSSFFTNAGNLSSGIVPVARLSGTYDINILRNAATATNADYATSAGNADTVDGRHASEFALSGHIHGQYVQKTGDTMTGTLTFGNTLSSANKLLDLQQGYAVYSDNTGGSNNTRLWVDAPNGGEVVIGPRAGANFLNDIRLRSQVISLETNGNQNGVTVNGNAVWHAGNDGSGSGLDADTIDGKHASEIGGLIPNGIKQYLTAGTYTWTKNAGTKFVLVKIWGAGAGAVGTAGTSQFGSYVYAYGGSITTSGTLRIQYTSTGGSASGGDINVPGKAGSTGKGGDSGNTPGSGAIYGMSGVTVSTGSGGQRVETINYFCSPPSFGGGGLLPILPGKCFGGGGGGYAEKWIDVSSVSSVTVVVGAGTGSGASKGADGAVIIYEYK